MTLLTYGMVLQAVRDGEARSLRDKEGTAMEGERRGFRLDFRRGDLIAILLVAVLAAVTALAFMPGSGQESGFVQIYLDGALVREFPLSQDREEEITGEYTNIVAVEGGRVRVAQSDCPGGDCMRTGAIGSAGRSIVCLPNRMEIRITGESDVDIALR